ncbi:MSCRAMM family protein [Lactococcus petauri]|uniref:MSCRAMM family protein n=1 Tax=Lactococcus petauri TaxID=1940789 RepID=UPI003A4E3254
MSKFQQIFRGLVAKRPVLFSLLCLLLLATGITGTWAWSSGRQSAINDGQVQTAKRTVQLLKLERDTAGNTTNIPVPGADFALYEITQQDPEVYEQVGTVRTTDADGRISVALPPGRYFFREVRLPYGFAPDKDQQGQELKRYDFTVEPSTPNGSTVVTAYNRRLSGDLIIEKTLKNDDGRELSELQGAQKFEFRVTFSDGGTYSYQINGEGEEHQLASGETLKLRHGQRAVFSALPVGLHYEVEEVGFQHGQAHNTSGNINHEAPSVVAFTNFGKTRTLDIKKEVINFDGSEVTEEQKLLEFEFTIQLPDVPEDASFRYTTNRYQIDDDPENDDDIREGKLAHGDTIKLRHGEILIIHDLPIGISYKVIESVRTDFVSETEYIRGEIVADTAGNRHLFRNIYQPEGQLPSFTALAFTKFLYSDDSADLKEYFEFEVILEPHEGRTFQYRIVEGDKEGDLIDFVSGDIIRLRHGQKALFQDLPPGLTYRLREISTDSYIEALQEIKWHTVNVPKEEQANKAHKTEKTVEMETNDDADDSDDSDEVPADNNDLHVVRFPNYRIPSERAKLILQKLVEGVGYDAGHEFVFDLYINDVKDREIRLRSGESSVPIELELGDRWRVVEHDSFDAGFSQQSIEYGTGSVEDEHRNRNIYVRQTNRYLRSNISLSG